MAAGAWPDEVPMQMTPYLSFKGECEEAFAFYAKCLGGELGGMLRYAGSPAAAEAPAGWQDKIMHGSLAVGDQVLMGADVAPDRYEEPRGRARFGVLVDRFGIPWLINCEVTEPPPEG